MKLFISYAREDKELCQQIAQRLMTAHKVWYDQDLLVGQNWEGEINAQLKGCEGFVYLISSHTLKSEYCRKELDIARRAGKCIFPVLIEAEAKIPTSLRDIQYVDLSHEAESIRMLMDALTIAEREKRRPNWITVALLAVIVLIMIVAAIWLGHGIRSSNDGEEGSKTRAAAGLVSNLTPSPSTPDPTLDPQQMAQTPVSRNTAWQPVIEAFDGVDMVLVPIGCFMMGNEKGADDEKPVHRVCFEEPYWIDQTEVTNAQFAAFGGQAANASYFPDDPRPREQVTWSEAAAYCEHRGGRLPTEAEWEYAARGPEGLIYPWGNRWDPYDVVWAGNSNNQTGEVGSKPAGASWVGALDMSGNVWEWVEDWYALDYYETLDDGVVNPTGPETGEHRGLRGGTWAGSTEDDFRASFRFDANPQGWDYYIGFRCVRSG